MRKHKRFTALTFGVLILVLLLSACGGGLSGASGGEQAPSVAEEEYFGRSSGGDTGVSAYDSDEAGSPPMEPMPQQGAVAGENTSTNSQQQPIERLIIRTGSITVTVDDTREVLETVEEHIESMASDGAFVVSSNVYGGTTDVSPYISISIRVPAERFDETMQFLTDLAVEGTTPTMSQSGQDVTEEYVDLASRLESLEAARDRLQEIMANAQTTEELLLAESQLTQREAEIESIKGRMQFLSQSAALSNITIELQPYVLSQPVDTRWRPAETIREALDALLESLRDLGDFLIYTVIVCGPYLLVIIPLLYVAYRFIRNQWRKRRERRASAAAAANVAANNQP